MSSVDWVASFLAAGPDYRAEQRSVVDMQVLLLKAGLGAGLPPRHAQDVAGLAARLMSDPHLMAVTVAALEGDHFQVRAEGTTDHLVIEEARIIMAAPVLVDAFVGGASRVVVHDLDWPMLLWPVLAQAQQTYGLFFEISRIDAKTLLVTRTTTDTLQLFGAVQPVPLQLLHRLEELAFTTTINDSFGIPESR